MASHRSQTVHVTATRRASVVVLAPLIPLALLCSCKTPTPDAREELRRSLRGADVTGYTFRAVETESHSTTSLTNPALREPLTLDKAHPHAVLSYARVYDKKAGTSKAYRTEVVPSSTGLALRVTDLDTNAIAMEKTFPAPPQPHEGVPCPSSSSGPFGSLSACIAEFDCACRGAMQCEVNKTCEEQVAALSCCLTNGQCFSVHIVVKPNSIRCQVADVIPDFEGLVLSP